MAAKTKPKAAAPKPAAKKKGTAATWSPFWLEERMRGMGGVSHDDMLALYDEELPLVEAELKAHRKGYTAYQEARALAREGKNAKTRKEAAARQERHRPAYTAYKRAYTRLLQLRKARPRKEGAD